MQPSVTDLGDFLSNSMGCQACVAKTVRTWITDDSCAAALKSPLLHKVCLGKAFLKNKKVPYSKSAFIWDKDMVLDYYKKLATPLFIMELLQKAVILTLLATEKQPSEIRQFTLDSIVQTQNSIVFTLPFPTKTSPDKFLDDRFVTIEHFKSHDPLDKLVCPYCTLVNYIKESKKIQKKDVKQVFVITTTGTPVALANLT